MSVEYFSVKAGDLYLQVNQKGDIFHAADIELLEVLPKYEEFIGIETIGFGDGLPSINGRRIEKLSVVIPGKDTLINGSYKDNMPVDFTTNYNMKIYITYQTEE